MSRHDLYQRYRQYHRYRHTFRALQYHNIRRRLWNQTRLQMLNNNDGDNHNNDLPIIHNIHNYDIHNNDSIYFLPQLTFNDTSTNNDALFLNSALNDNNSSRNNISRLSNILTFNSTLSDDDNDNNIKLKVIAPKLKHNTSSRLDGLQDFKAAFALIPIRLTCVDPFKQKIFPRSMYRRYQKLEEDDDDDDGDYNYDDNDDEDEYDPSYDDDDDYDMNKHRKIHVISGIDKNQNLLSQLSSDLHLIILNMLTGLGNVRTMALYKSLRSELTEWDMERAVNCSVYKSQALFVERYRQNLFDEKYKAQHAPALVRALSDEPKNLFEFQKEREARVLRRQSSNMSISYNCNDDDDQKQT